MNRAAACSLVPALLLSIAQIGAQDAADRALLEAEQARDAAVPLLLAAAGSGNARSQMLAARALGRLENPDHRDAVFRLLTSPDARVRRVAAGALAQMRANAPWADPLKREPDGSVRAAIFEAIGRAKPLADDAEATLAAGLRDADPLARAGAARGLESLFRLNGKPLRKAEAGTIDALHRAFAINREEQIRELILLTLRSAGDHDNATLTSALTDRSAQVRRLAVIETRTWLRDPSPIVRYEALRAAPTCDRAVAAVSDSSDHVALAAVDLLGTLKCGATPLIPLVSAGRGWRTRAHALVSLAAVDPAGAQAAIKSMAADPTWQLRVYVAKAARILNDSSVLAALARDMNPDVAIAAMTTPDDAAWALTSEHSGLIRAGAERLKNTPGLKDRLPQLVATLHRLTAGGAMTVRDPRIAVLTRIGEIDDPGTDPLLRETLRDRDPAVAALAARILSARTGTPVAPQNTRLPVPALPSAEYIRGLVGSTARIAMRGLGTISVDLLTEEAPVTVATFAQLAEAGQYNGLTFHRIVPNFVIQGGSPGADEYDGLSREFMRDEVGFARNARGSIGISTRGRDTGDAQVYFNLVDNFRLDRDYTVFATIRAGLAVMDRVQEGDVIDAIQIIRRQPNRQRRE